MKIKNKISVAPQSKQLEEIAKELKRCNVTLYCYACKRNLVKGSCPQTGESLNHCPNADRHVFKSYVGVPGTRQRKTKRLQAKDWLSAIQEAILFKEKIKSGNYIEESKPANEIDSIRAEKISPVLLGHCIARYIGWLNNENVPEHQQRERSREYLAEVERALKIKLDCLQSKGYDVASLKAEELNNEMVGKIYAYLLKEKKYAYATFNKYVTIYVSFVSWMNKELNLSIRNWFETIERKKPAYNPKSISREIFEKLLVKITPENGIKEYTEGKKRIRNYYRYWLKDAFRLALHTGLRREELINLKFSHISDENKDDIPDLITAENIKVNRIQGRVDQSEKKFKHVPITKALLQILNDLGYEQHKGEDRFLLANEIKAKRKRAMGDILSRGFTHFYEKLNEKEKLNFGCLRKTYITQLNLQYGGNAKFISDHSDEAVVGNHYIDPKLVASVAKDFEVFPETSERKEELEKIRDNKIQKEQNINLGK